MDTLTKPNRFSGDAFNDHLIIPFLVFSETFLTCSVSQIGETN